MTVIGGGKVAPIGEREEAEDIFGYLRPAEKVHYRAAGGDRNLHARMNDRQHHRWASVPKAAAAPGGIACHGVAIQKIFVARADVSEVAFNRPH